MPDLSDATVVITGAAGGLGGRVAGALARRGARLMLVDIDGDRLEEVSRQVGGVALVGDIADADDRERILAACGEPDVLINNAGVEKASAYTDLAAVEVRRALEVNLLGTMLLTRGVLTGMRLRDRGHVITIASLAGIKPVPFNAVYNTAKAGLVAFSISLSKELDGTPVRATVICPSAVTGVGMWARTSAQLSPNRLVERSAVSPDAVVAAVMRALERAPRRILVGSRLVRVGALLSALSPAIDRTTDRASRIHDVYRERVFTDRDHRL